MGVALQCNATDRAGAGQPLAPSPSDGDGRFPGVGACSDFACNATIFAPRLRQSSVGKPSPIPSAIRLVAYLGTTLVCDRAVLRCPFGDRLGTPCALGLLRRRLIRNRNEVDTHVSSLPPGDNGRTVDGRGRDHGCST